ncbi:MAG: ElyC/SanA/YdcF family protein [Candidatus Omnitrophica bacterium]|nr:ElyC/SanA/YdcF family protein [Candidatus Omnitrophota bacterium]
MLEHQDIICISSIDWDFIWQGHQEIMSALAKAGNRVLFIENTGVRHPGIRDIPRIQRRVKNWLKGVKGIRQEGKNLYIYSPLVLPFPYSRFARWVNCHLVFSVLDKWFKVMNFGDPIVWTFLPTPLSSDIIDNLVKKLTVYYCIDNFRASSASARRIERSEADLLKKADLVFVTSNELHRYCSRYNKNVHFFPFAVSYEKFENIRLNESAAPAELGNINKPIVGYVGGMHKWVDQPLIRAVARRRGDLSFVFVGPIQDDISSLSDLDNVHFLGKKEHDRLPCFIKSFDVCIIPYSLTDYTKNVYPTKLNEYFAMGKPVVSTGLPEIISFNERHNNMVYTAEGAEGFTGAIERALREDNSSLAQRRIDIARENSWSNSIVRMNGLIEDSLLEKQRLNIDSQWMAKLSRFYKKARRRTVIFGIVCLLIYVILFKSPFIWFVAGPLKISDGPRKADAIVVFGGGVGETGSPGKSTIERARYAAGLYKQQYADKIVFSAGYTYNYNDAENMMLFALSEGVPRDDITLDKNGNNTYENVKFTAEILDRQGWDSILLVSSPYNMARASLVYRKIAAGIKVSYTPVPNPQFYNRRSGSRLEQIKAILHEYLGILYYWWKGYI